nr:MAG TPA: hypothetical protein [Caudoviricetes sp.]
MSKLRRWRLFGNSQFAFVDTTDNLRQDHGQAGFIKFTHNII